MSSQAPGHRLGMAACAAFFAWPLAAAAQTGAAPVPTLPEISAKGEAGGSLTVPSVEANRTALESIAGSVSFIDAQSFANRYTNNLSDALRDTPGIAAQTRYGQELRLSIRGSGIARGFHTRGVEILQDGIPFTLADGSGDLYQVDPLNARAVELYRGGNALAFGTSTLGGAINFVSPTAYTGVAPAFVRFEGGSFGALRTQVQGSAVSGPADALINYTYSHQDGFRQHQNQDYHQLNLNIGYRIAPGVETRFFGGIYETRQKLPGTLSLREALTVPTRASMATLMANQKRDVSAQRIANRTTFQLDLGQIDLDSWYIHKSLFHPIFQVIDQDGYTAGIAPRWSGSFALGDLRNDLTAGGRFVTGRNSALQFVNLYGRPQALTASARQNSDNYEAFIDNKLWVTPEIALMLGAKLFRNDRDFENRFVLPFRTAGKSYDGFNPKLGILYQPASNVQVFADITRSRDVPDFSDLAQANLNGLTFVPLQAQKAWTAEIGTRGTYDRFKWEATYYRSEIRDELINYSTNAALGIPAATFNADKTRHQGIELAASVDLLRDISGPDSGDTLTLSQVYTYNDFAFVKDRIYRNNEIAGIPPHVLRTVLTYRHPAGFYVAPSVDWVPQGAFADHANTLKTPAYALLGFQTGMSLPHGVSVYLDARNLTNKRYVSDIGVVTDARRVATTIFYPGEGRAVFAGLKVTF